VSYQSADDSSPTDSSLGDTNGAGSPGAGIRPTHGVWIIIGGSVVFLFIAGKVLRGKSKAALSASVTA